MFYISWRIFYRPVPSPPYIRYFPKNYWYSRRYTLPSIIFFKEKVQSFLCSSCFHLSFFFKDNSPSMSLLKNMLSSTTYHFFKNKLPCIIVLPPISHPHSHPPTKVTVICILPLGTPSEVDQHSRSVDIVDKIKDLVDAVDWIFNV